SSSQSSGVHTRHATSNTWRAGATSEIRMIGDESVALVKLRGAVTLQQACGASRKRTHMERQHHMLGHHFSGGIQNRTAGILGFANDRRVARAKQGILHLLDDAGQPRLNDL